MTRILRWKAIVPLLLLVILVVAAWWLFLDLAVERGIEYVGTEIVGARVDLASARVALGRGAVTLRGLEVTDPGHPMTNLVQADQIVAQVRLLPLLEKKVVIDTVAARGVRFGTPRRTSGALAHKSPTTGRVAQAISAWAGGVRIPSLDFKGLGGVVDVSRIRADSLRTIAQARAVQQRADSLRQAWQQGLAGLDPQPQIDTARALIARLKQADVKALGLTGTRDLITSARGTLGRLGQVTNRLDSLHAQITQGAGALRGDVNGLAAAREADYAFASSLVNLPSLSTPDLSPALFGDMALARIQPVLYWLALAQQYLPPGLDPRRQVGPKRVRAAGTTVRFPLAHQDPAFLLVSADADAELGGTGAAAAHYAARLTGLTTAPTLYGRPTVFQAARTGAARGPQAGRVVAVLDHVRAPVRDSVNAVLEDVALPTVALPAAGARLALGRGSVALSIALSGDNLNGSMSWRSDDVRWRRAAPDSTTRPPDQASAIGSAAWVQDVLWRTVSHLTSVDVEVRVSGRVSAPSLGVRSNVGQAVAQALQREVGAEVSRQEQRVRARVDQLVQGQVQAAQTQAADAQTKVQAALAAKQADVGRARADLEAQITALTRKLPFRIP
jgi:uncharacterized protein (TIGR03545 family)